MTFPHDELLQVFLAESEETLANMEEGLIRLEADPDDRPTLEELFRGAHTLKGNAAALGFNAIGEFSHALEDLLEPVRSRALQVTGELVSLLLQAVDVLRTLVGEAGTGHPTLWPDQRALAERLRAMAGLGAGGAGPAEQSAPAASAEGGRRAGTPAAGPDRAQTLRVDVGKLDRLLTLTGEIAIARGRIRQMLARDGLHRLEEIREAHRESDRLYVDLQELVMKARMVPLGPTFRQHIRTVRDVSTSQGKSVRLTILGADVEVDTGMIERIRDPLTHLVRNALDHGIESTAARRAAGKDPCGRIILEAQHDAGNVVIRVSDDGAGLDRDAILARARRQGLVAPGETPAASEILDLIFEPGFSTADEVTELSGRGVGMDVVRRNVEQLRGAISVESRPHEGTTIAIRLPLTVAIIRGFGVGVSGETYIVPLDAVVECLRFPPEAQDTGDSGILDLRGSALPYLRLSRCLGVSGPPPERESVVVVRHGPGRAGLVVDDLLGECEAVIKPLGTLFRGLPGVSGSTVLGSGKVALILDVPGLLQEFGREESQDVAATPALAGT
jgi:two-component system, chemotaxis family, sensor kinase CheA